MSELVCDVCPHHCRLKEGRTGRCRARKNEGGKNVSLNYGKLTSLAVDPIEKKPLAGFFPGSYILSAGSFGCNLSCPFCQNHEISMHGESELRHYDLTPAELVSIALGRPESIGVAFTYNEPLISWEFIRDTAVLLKKNRLKTVLVTNGCVTRKILDEVLPYTDAMNIDLKGDEAFYRELGGDHDTVRETIAEAVRHCHVEVTTLIVPGKNDSEEFIREEAKWLAAQDPGMILHLSRYFPRYKYKIPPTDIGRMKQLREIAREYLPDVRLGNVW